MISSTREKRTQAFVYAMFLAFSAALLFSTSANAILVTDTLDVEVIDGPGLGETGTIAVTYDTTDVPVTGSVILVPSQFELLLNIFGQTFTEADDILFGFGDFPVVDFTDGAIVFIDFVISEFPIDGPNTVEINDPRIGEIDGATIGGDVVDGVWQVATKPAPAPATLALLILGLAGFSLQQRKRVKAA